MKTESEVILEELDDVAAIVDVAWRLETVEAGPVSRSDIRVQLRAADLVLKLGAAIRASHVCEPSLA